MTLSCPHPEGRRLPLQPYLSNLYGRNLISLICFTTVLVFSVAGVSSSGQDDDCPLNSKLEIMTSQNDIYYFDIPHGAIGIDFKVKADTNAGVFLVPIDIMNGFYSVNIGRQSDTQSATRFCSPCSYFESMCRCYNYHPSSCFSCSSLKTVPTNDFLNLEEFRQFWIRFGNNKIDVGMEKEETPFMSCELGSYSADFNQLAYRERRTVEFRFCNFVYDSDVSSSSPSVPSSSSPFVPSSSDTFSKTTSSTKRYAVEDVGITSDLKDTSPSISDYQGQTSHQPYRSPPDPDLSSPSASPRRSTRPQNHTASSSKGEVTLWPLAAVCFIPVILFVTIYVMIKRKQARNSKQTTEHSPVNKVQPGNFSSSLQNGNNQYVLSNETRDADTDMVDNVAYQSTEDFPVPSQGATSNSSINKDAYLTGDTIYNVAYESYSKPRKETNASAKIENGDSEYEYAYTG